MEVFTQLFVGACWIFFLVYWVIGARATKKTNERQSRSTEAIYRLPLIIGILFFEVPIKALPWNYIVFPHVLVLQVLVMILCVLGLAGAIWARRTLAKNWSSDVTFKEDHELVERGPYHFVRHPIYTSLLLMFLASTIMIGRLSTIIGFVMLGVSFILKLKQEEKMMLKHFPNEYEGYRSRVKTLVPFVW